MKTFSIKLSGPAGAGMMQAGETLSKALNRLGFYSLMYPEYPSRIRGGDNHVLVVFSEEKCLAPVEKIDLLLAFGRENLERHLGEIREIGKIREKRAFEAGEIGLEKIAKELGNPLVANTAGLGFIWNALGFDMGVLEEELKEEFKGKEEILKLNLESGRRGYERARGIGEIKGIGEIRGKREIKNYSGNEALVEGILEANCGFAAIYPMTPINSILTMLSRPLTPERSDGGQARSKVQVFRPEDEVAGMLAALGASYAGKRAMVATSGGGFSLMVEGLGMAGMAEIPIVCVVGQRTGPSTGMATYSSQADLNFVINAGQGEFPRIILAPGDIGECLKLGVEAFNLAEKYQVPVILLTDKYLAESRFSVDKEETIREIRVDRGKLGKDGGYERYQFARDGISPRALPGQTAFLTNSYEHDEYGFSSDDKENRKKMMEKRMGKLKGLEGPARHASQLAGVAGRGFELFGKFGGKKQTLVGWGSTKEIILDFLKDHPDYNFLHIWRPWPFPKEAAEVLKKTERIIVVEGNYSGQMADLIERFTFRKVKRVLKDDGRPFFKEELEGKLLKILK